MESLRNKAYGMLRSSEQLFRTDMVYVAKGGFWLSVGQIIATLSGFLVSLAFANFFSKESFGVYKFIISMAGIISALSLTGISTAVTRSVAKGFEPLRQGFRLNLRWSIGMLLAGLGLATYYYLNDNALLAFSFILIGIIPPLTASASLYAAYLLGKKDFRRNALYGIIYSLVTSGTVFTAILLTRDTATVITAYFCSGALIALILYRKTLKAYKPATGTDDPSLLSYGGHLSAMEIAGRVASYLDKILIFHYLGAAPLAVYSFAVAPVEQLQSGKKILSTLVLPRLSGRPFAELQKSAPRKTVLLIIYALALAGLWALAAPYFYKWLYPQYLDSVFYSQIYGLTLLAIGATLFQETLVAHQKTKELYFHRTIVPLLQLALFAIMLPFYGLMGLIITHVIMRSFSGLVAYFLVKHPFSASSN